MRYWFESQLERDHWGDQGIGVDSIEVDLKR
jgi:hypothetical protein